MRLLYCLTLLAVPLGLWGADPPKSKPSDQWEFIPPDCRPVPNGWANLLRSDPQPPDARMPRGLKKTPRSRLLKAAIERPFVVPAGLKLPASVTYVPAKLSYWLNNKYGCCVSTEEAFNQDACGVFITDQTLYNFAAKYRWLNGAYLEEVMDQMAKDGFHQDGKVYGTGPYKAVNFADEPTLQAALSIAPVKIGIDADALPSGAGNKSGWFATGGREGQYQNEDHCIPLCGFGPPAVLFKSLGFDAVPSGWRSTSATAYLAFTWNTIGVVDHDWIMSTCGEAFLRNPTASVDGKPSPNPGPGPNPPTPPDPPVPPLPPVPPVPGKGFTGTMVYTNGVLTQIVPGGAVPGGDVEADLKAAGVSPALIADVLKLLVDIRTKAGKEAILADVLKIVSDLQTP